MIVPPRRSATLLLAGTLVLGVSACGKSASSSSTSAAGASVSVSRTASMTDSSGASASADPASCKKVRFALHAGLGAGALHRYLWKPYQAGTFSSGASGRKTAIVKAALAGGFAYHEFTVALNDIQSCPSATAVTAAVQDGLSKAAGMATGLKSGNIDPKALTAVNTQVASIESAAKTSGINVQEQDPSALQLATNNTGN
jgi:hypothetical protein